VQTSPPWITPIGLKTDSSGLHVKTTRPGSAATMSNSIKPAIGGGGRIPSTIARM